MFLTLTKEMTTKQLEVTIKREEVAISKEAVNVKREGTELEERQVGSKEKRFQLTQREDEHSLRMDWERIELEDRGAKRQRYIQKTKEETAISAILNDMVESAKNPEGFVKQAEVLLV